MTRCFFAEEIRKLWNFDNSSRLHVHELGPACSPLTVGRRFLKRLDMIEYRAWDLGNRVRRRRPQGWGAFTRGKTGMAVSSPRRQTLFR